MAKLGKFLGYELPSDERREVLDGLFVFGKDKQRPYLIRLAVLIVVSTIIATGGLLSNSAAVVIGAMLVAPMMRPVMAAAAAITLGWAQRLYQSLILVVVMTIGVVTIAALLTLLAPELIAIPEQIIARTVPTFFDLVIALASGVGGAYVMTRKESSAIPGVAMAVSLLPPLASCGILLVLNEIDFAVKAFVLFVTNFLAMTLAGSATFFVVGISSLKARKRSSAFIRNYTLVFVILIVAVSVPLTYYSKYEWYGAEYKAAKSVQMQSWLQENKLELIDVRINDRKQILYLNLLGAEPPLSIQGLHQALKERRAELGEYREFSIETVWMATVNSSWPPPSNITSKPDSLKKPVPIETSPLINIEWFWKQTQYSDRQWIKSTNPKDYMLIFDDKNKVTGKVSCNPLKAGYQLSTNLFSIKQIVITRAMCENTELDTVFINDIGRVINFEIKKDTLVLQLDNNAGLMYFERK